MVMMVVVIRGHGHRHGDGHHDAMMMPAMVVVAVMVVVVVDDGLAIVLHRLNRGGCVEFGFPRRWGEALGGRSPEQCRGVRDGAQQVRIGVRGHGGFQVMRHRRRGNRRAGGGKRAHGTQ